MLLANCATRLSIVTCIVLCALLTTNPLAADEKDEEPATKIVYQEDLVYGRVHGAGLLADVAYPEPDKPLPAIISVHGGRWRGGHKRDGSTIKVKQWAGFGFWSMSIDYRLDSGTCLLSGFPMCYPLRP